MQSKVSTKQHLCMDKCLYHHFFFNKYTRNLWGGISEYENMWMIKGDKYMIIYTGKVFVPLRTKDLPFKEWCGLHIVLEFDPSVCVSENEMVFVLSLCASQTVIYY